MGIADQQMQQRFPFPYQRTYDGVIEVLPRVGLKVKSHDKVLGRITASSGMSLFSWGENLVLVIEKLDETNTMVSIESSLKLGINIAGAHRHQKNFNRIIEALSAHLQRG